ncbi:MAG TPA: ribosome-associated translation inhibitor RaiA [Ktedonobacteraceae bacterium]|jgi:putative sigma-54 modulation protein|nr:ribosome-associated translation inhibitor RaiA [Ktedonobacteraceae bacterium]
MQIVIKGKQLPVTPLLRDKIERKTRKLAHFVTEDTRVEVTVAEEQTRSAQDRFSVHLALSGNASPIYSEVSALNVTTALDKVLDKVVAQLGRQKKRQTTARRHHTPAVKVLALARSGELTSMEEEEASTPLRVDDTLEPIRNEEIWSQVMEIRQLPTRAMGDQEVIDQMERSGASFLPFYNEETSSINVMYRLAEGGYGLLVPAME